MSTYTYVNTCLDCVHSYLAVMILICPVGIVVAGVQTYLQTFLHIDLLHLLNYSVGSLGYNTVMLYIILHNVILHVYR